MALTEPHPPRDAFKISYQHLSWSSSANSGQHGQRHMRKQVRFQETKDQQGFHQSPSRPVVGGSTSPTSTGKSAGSRTQRSLPASTHDRTPSRNPEQNSKPKDTEGRENRSPVIDSPIQMKYRPKVRENLNSKQPPGREDVSKSPTHQYLSQGRTNLKAIGAEKSKIWVDDCESKDSGFDEDFEEVSVSSDEEVSLHREDLETHATRNRKCDTIRSTSQNPSLSKRQLKRQRQRERKQEINLPSQNLETIKDKLREENERLKRHLYCRVCMDAPVGAMLIPCRHSVLCWQCAQRLRDCPVCREVTKTRVNIYLSCS